MYKISIIIPLWNASGYIKHCARSLFEQTIDAIEYIFVDDGSTDNSVNEIEDVLNDFPWRRNAVTIIRKTKNEGVSSARNYGIKIAKGEYIGFCDSDDWVESDMYKNYLSQIERYHADIVIGDILLEKKSGTKYYSSTNFSTDKITFLKEYLSSHWTTVYNILVKRSVIIDNQLEFPPQIGFCEDLIFMVKLFWFSKNIVNEHKAYYHYNQENQSSITHFIDERKADDQLNSYLDLISFFSEKGIEEKLRQEMAYRIILNKRRFVYNKEKQNLFNTIYPESNKYIFTCPWITMRMKMLMWALTHHLVFLANIVISLKKDRFA